MFCSGGSLDKILLDQSVILHASFLFPSSSSSSSSSSSILILTGPKSGGDSVKDNCPYGIGGCLGLVPPPLRRCHPPSTATPYFMPFPPTANHHDALSALSLTCFPPPPASQQDIAARNCLVGENFHIFVTDFGCVHALMRSNAVGGRTTHSRFPAPIRFARIKENAQAEYARTLNAVGPVKHMSPEAMREKVPSRVLPFGKSSSLTSRVQKYSEKSDAFSFGVLLWEVSFSFSHRFPSLLCQSVHLHHLHMNPTPTKTAVHSKGAL